MEGMGTYPQGSLGLASALIPTLAFLLLLCRALNLPLMGEASMGKGTGEGEQAGFLGGVAGPRGCQAAAGGKDSEARRRFQEG